MTRVSATAALPERVVVGANGAYWRDYGSHYSMCPVSEDNDPVEVVAVYELGSPATARQHDGDASPERLNPGQPQGTRGAASGPDEGTSGLTQPDGPLPKEKVMAAIGALQPTRSTPWYLQGFDDAIQGALEVVYDAALPSPAPEPPPLIQDSIRRIVQVLDNDEGGAELYEAAIELRRLVIDSPEWWRAAQPAPDLDVERLAAVMEETQPGTYGRVTSFGWMGWAEKIAAAYASLAGVRK